ncbi:ABC transporter ATP-binding protein [Algiphilus sp.]|uniref:ABC transporter ATP-binding protein n=1 Tax=Algiphilus sp. TaxID=1872431 RepID=UPI003B5198F2
MSQPLMALDSLCVDVPERADGDPLRCRFEGGQSWAILGPNGAGKTTLLMTLAGLRAPRRGRILLDGMDLTRLPRRRVAQRLGVLFQHHHDGFPATVRETALMGRHPHLRAWELEHADDLHAAEAALARVDLLGLAERSVQTLSGGERQRLAFATLLTQDPTLLLLDEPTSHLDLHHQIAMLEMIGQEVAAGRCAIMATHDINLAARYCSHVLLLYPDGRSCWGSTDIMLSVPALEQLYRQPLATGTVDDLPVFLPRTNS